jgi:type I restriction enzyme S subunit
VRVIRLENLAHLAFIGNKRTYISEEKYIGLKQNAVVEGDILFGSFVEDTVRVCLVPPLDTPAITKADCFCVRTRPDLVMRDYLVLQLASTSTHDSLIEEVHGATRPRITTKQLRALRVPLCSMQEQREIVGRVSALFALADSIERRLAIAIARTDKLPQAILAKAFRGELVPTEAELARAEGRDYEPASALLERIRTEREAAGPTASRGRKKAASDKAPAKDKRARAGSARSPSS